MIKMFYALPYTTYEQKSHSKNESKKIIYDFQMGYFESCIIFLLLPLSLTSREIGEYLPFSPIKKIRYCKRCIFSYYRKH